MSEAITKACETCAGVGRPMTWNGIVDCVDCSGTGRVPDDEAMLRAEVGRLTAEVERLKAMTIEAVKGTSLTIIDAIGGTAQQTIEGLRAEVVRLTARESEAARILSFVSTAHALAWAVEANKWLEGCKS